MPFTIVRDDITLVHADAIVNAANEQLRMGGGVCGAIFSAAGAARLQKACNKIGHCDTGSAVSTPAFNLPARYVIHTVGPIWRGGSHGERQLLESCYRSSLELAESLGCASIAFPLISAGIYGYPQQEALQVAREQIIAFLQDHEMDVRLVLFNAGAVRLADDLRLRVEHYIDDVYVGAHTSYRVREGWESAYLGNIAAAEGSAEPAGAQEGEIGRYCTVCGSPLHHKELFCPHCGAMVDGAGMPDLSKDSAETYFDMASGTGLPAQGLDFTLSVEAMEEAAPVAPAAAMPSASPAAPKAREEATATHGPRPRPQAKPAAKHGIRLPGMLANLLKHMDAGFSETLLAMIDERGLKDAQVYKRANLSRQHFSKIRSNPAYKPTKTTVLALAVALELSPQETDLLLERAGFTFSHADRRDVIVEFFINEGIYDVFQINEALFAFDQPLLG